MWDILEIVNQLALQESINFVRQCLFSLMVFFPIISWGGK